MPEVIFRTKGVDDVIFGHKRAQKAGEESAAVQIKKLADVLRSELKLRGERDRSAKKQESDTRRWERLVANAQRSQETGYERIKRKTMELSEAVKRTGADETLVSKERTRMILEYNRKVDANKNKLREVQEESKDVGKASENAFGGPAIDRLKMWGATLVQTLGPLALIQQALQDKIRLEERSLEIGRESRGGIGQLRQLANTQEQFDRLNKQAEALFKAGAVTDLDEAGRVIFQLASAGLADEESLRIFRQLGTKGVVPDLGTFARAIRTLTASVGVAETGTATQIMAKAFAASEFSPASVEQLLEAAAIPGGIGRTIGLTDEQILAATATLATATGGAETGATALRSFLFSTAEQEKFKGMDLRQRVAAIGAMQLDAAGLLKFLGRKEAVQAFTSLQTSMADYDKALLAVDRANRDMSAISRKVGFRDPIREAAEMHAAQRATTQVQMLPAGAWEALRRSVFEREERERRERFGDFFGGLINVERRAGFGINRAIGLVDAEDFMRTMLEGERRGMDRMTPEEERQAHQLIELQRQQLEETKETNRKLDRVGGFVGIAE